MASWGEKFALIQTNWKALSRAFIICPCPRFLESHFLEMSLAQVFNVFSYFSSSDEKLLRLLPEAKEKQRWEHSTNCFATKIISFITIFSAKLRIFFSFLSPIPSIILLWLRCWFASVLIKNHDETQRAFESQVSCRKMSLLLSTSFTQLRLFPYKI